MKKIKTIPMDKAWYEDCKANGFTADSVYEYWNAEPLKRKLLAIGGQAVCVLGKRREHDDYSKLLKNGQFVLGSNIKMWKLADGRCHQNVEYIITRWPHFEGFTGYALSQDGVWRYHSWVFDPVRDFIRETTEPRLIYYGIPF